MISCRDVEVLLQDYLDGYLLPSQREVLEAHLHRCAECRRLLSDQRRLEDEMLKEAEEVELPGNLVESIMRSLPPDAYGQPPRRRYLALGAAPLLLVVVAGLFFLLKGRYQLRSEGAERMVELSLTAPSASSVSVVGDFNRWDPSRNVMLRLPEGRWRARLKLPPGTYQYSFVIDGHTWAADPSADNNTADGFGGENSVIVVDG